MTYAKIRARDAAVFERALQKRDDNERIRLAHIEIAEFGKGSHHLHPNSKSRWGVWLLSERNPRVFFRTREEAIAYASGFLDGTLAPSQPAT